MVDLTNPWRPNSRRRLSKPATGRVNFVNTRDGTLLAAVVSDTRSPRPDLGITWGSTYLLVWDCATGRERIRVERAMQNYHTAFSLVAITPDARLAATVSEGDLVEIWNGLTGERIQSFKAGNTVTAFAFSDDGMMLASGHQDGRVSLWNTRPASEKGG